jgi:putative transposase
MASYAKGLKLYQHRKVVEHNREMKRKADSADALMTSMRELENQLLDVHKKRQKHGTAMKLARFISGQRQRIKRSEIVQLDTPETPRLDYSSLTPDVFQPLAETGQSEIMAEPATVDPEDQTPSDNKPDETDIDAIRSRHGEWE